MKSIGRIVLWLATALWIAGCSVDLEDPKRQIAPGVTLVADLDGKYIKQNLLEQNVSGVDENTTVYGQRVYKIVYGSVDIHGNPIKASGVIVVPKGMPKIVDKQLGYSLVLEHHGTIFKQSDAPSVQSEATMMPGKNASVIFTSLSGFITLMPDYVGFGESRGKVHPFVMKRLAEDAVAMLKAAKAFLQDRDIKLNGQLFVSGYSEGGYAAMATLQKLEDRGEAVAMAAPMAGPYDLNKTAFGVLSKSQLSVPAFMANVAYAYTTAYGVPLENVINEPYASKLPALLDGSHEINEIDTALTKKTTGADGLFSPAFVNDFFTDDAHWFKSAALEQSVYAWAPQTPLKLLHCQGDEVIPFDISQATYATMLAMGANDVQLIPIEAALQEQGLGDGEPMGHTRCGNYAYGMAAQIFADMRKATVGY